MMPDRIDQQLSILTARQRQICELRGQKLTFQKIGAQLGVSASSARKTYQLALRRLRQQRAQEVQDALDRQPADFAVTCGELGLICSGLRLLCRDMHRRLRRSAPADAALARRLARTGALLYRAGQALERGEAAAAPHKGAK